MHLRANLRPIPVAWEPQPRKSPSFNLFPSIFSEENATNCELSFESIKLGSPRRYTVTINTKDKNIDHSSVLSNYFPDTCNLQGFANTTKQRVAANSNSCVFPAD